MLFRSDPKRKPALDLEAIELQANINELEVEQIESLGDALLDFTSIDDLHELDLYWLRWQAYSFWS